MMAEAPRGCYHDLCVMVQESKKRSGDILERLANFGYECIAFNHHLTLAKKVQIKPAPSISDLVESVPNVNKKQRPLQVLQRLTVSVEDASVLHALSSPAVESYDLVAIRPGTDRIFQQACSVLNVDIISVDLSERIPFNFKHPQVGQAIERGLHFEICYSPAIRDPTARRNTLANALELVNVSKGKSIIVSSEAEKVFDLRSPLDVSNLCHLFGLEDRQCKAAVTTNCRAVLLHSEMRRHTTKGVVSCTSLQQPQCKELQKSERKMKEKGTAGRQKRKRPDNDTADTFHAKQKKQ